MRVEEYVGKPDQLDPDNEQPVTSDNGSGQLSGKDSGGGDANTQNKGNGADSPCQDESEPSPVTEPLCAGCFACTNCVSNV